MQSGFLALKTVDMALLSTGTEHSYRILTLQTRKVSSNSSQLCQIHDLFPLDLYHQSPSMSISIETRDTNQDTRNPRIWGPV